MPSPLKLLAAAAASVLLLAGAHAEGPYRNPDNKNAADAGEGTYPVPYKKPQVAEITASLQRIRGYLDSVTPTRVVHKGSGAPVTDFSKPVADAIIEQSPADFGLIVYEMGVVHAGMLKAAAVTGDARFAALTARHLQFTADKLPYFKAQEQQFHLERAERFGEYTCCALGCVTVTSHPLKK